MKTCKECLKQKDMTEFYKHKRMADGLLNYCISCVKDRVADHRIANMEKVKAYDRNRPNAKERAEKTKLKDYRESRNKARKNWKLRNKEKLEAHYLVLKAVRAGKLIKKPCEVCGDVKSHGHHEDYSKPLDVVWLCNTHHKEVHKKINEQRRNAA